MPSSSLGYHNQCPPARTHAVIPSTAEGSRAVVIASKDSPSTSDGPCVIFVRMLYLLSCCVVGGLAYAFPTTTVETITTLDIGAQETSLSALLNVTSGVVGTFLGNANVTTILPGVASVDPSSITDTIIVFVRVMVTLILLASAGVLPKGDRFGRLLSLFPVVAALVLFLHTAFVDNGAVLKLWFVIAYSVAACGIPASVIGVELYRL